MLPVTSTLHTGCYIGSGIAGVYLFFLASGCCCCSRCMFVSINVFAFLCLTAPQSLNSESHWESELFIHSNWKLHHDDVSNNSGCHIGFSESRWETLFFVQVTLTLTGIFYVALLSLFQSHLPTIFCLSLIKPSLSFCEVQWPSVPQEVQILIML